MFTQFSPPLVTTTVGLAAVATAAFRFGVHHERGNSISRRVSLELNRFRDELTNGLAAVERRMRRFDDVIAFVYDHNRRLALLEHGVRVHGTQVAAT